VYKGRGLGSSSTLLQVYIARVCKGLTSCSTTYLQMVASRACTLAKCCFPFQCSCMQTKNGISCLNDCVAVLQVVAYLACECVSPLLSVESVVKRSNATGAATAAHCIATEHLITKQGGRFIHTTCTVYIVYRRPMSSLHWHHIYSIALLLLSILERESSSACVAACSMLCYSYAQLSTQRTAPTAACTSLIVLQHRAESPAVRASSWKSKLLTGFEA
jgi:hypothetical protein